MWQCLNGLNYLTVAIHPIPVTVNFNDVAHKNINSTIVINYHCYA